MSYSHRCVHQEQQRLRPGSVKRKGPFFSMTMPNCISLYSADLSPTDYHSFKHLENFIWNSHNNESFCEPFLSNGNAIFLCRNNPSTCCVLPTVPNPRFGILAALEDKFREGFRIQSSVLEPLKVTVYGTCPDPEYLWSNIDVVNGKGMLVTMEPTSGSCFLNVLNFMPGSIPRFFWQQTQLLTLFAKKNPDQFVFRVIENSQGLSITIRGTFYSVHTENASGLKDGAQSG
uniref:Phospholipid scramblase n=1 Tax=Heterorhabditis bacteriophora TaxID=37862 RepID=A0A1I7X5V9_HETBA